MLPRRKLCPAAARTRLVVLNLFAAACLLPSLSPGLSPTVAAQRESDSLPPPTSVKEMRAIEAKIRNLVSKVTACTVGVRMGNSNGSGVIISEDGLVMTAGHVVDEPGRDVIFLLADGKQAKGKTLGCFKTADAGLMKITDEGKWPHAPRGRSAELRPGTWCVAVGHPLGYQEKRPPIIRAGRILRLGDHVIQTDCPLVGGDSGGPLFDLEGQVIGINSRIGGSIVQNFHVPVDVFTEHWDRLVTGDSWKLQLPARDGSEMKTAMSQLVEAASRCAVRIVCDGKERALGTVVGPDGWILTKASELQGKVICRINGKMELEAKTVGIDPRFDLAMLKVDSTQLPRIEWNTSKQVAGQWVAAPGPDGAPLAMGVVSVPRRPIPLTPGMLGVLFKEGEENATIQRVIPKSPAEQAGLQPNDEVLAVNGKSAANRDELIAMVKKFRPGTAIVITVKRGEEELNIKATLGKLQTPATRKRDMQNALGVGVSKRRDAFPVVLQHDTVLRPADCGGPLVDLSGKVIGVNIARGGRTETYCVPSDVLVVLMYNLMSGRLRPSELAKAQAAAAAKREAQVKSEPKKNTPAPPDQQEDNQQNKRPEDRPEATPQQEKSDQSEPPKAHDSDQSKSENPQRQPSDPQKKDEDKELPAQQADPQRERAATDQLAS